MSVNPIKFISKEIPIHKNNKRIWIATEKLKSTKLIENLTYHYKINKKKKQLIIESNELDNRKITIRKTSDLPIIDICNEDITELFQGINKITVKIYNHQIVIEPLKEVLEQNRAKAKLKAKTITFIDIFAGAGTLTEAFKKIAKPIGAIEYSDEYLSYYESNNKNTITYNTSVTDMDVSLLDKRATILIGGIPCENFCPSGIAKQKNLKKKSKEQGLTGHLGYYFLKAIEQVRPALVVIEEVIGFRKSIMMDIIRKVLIERGYTLSEKILKANDYGSMTKRKRFCCVATIGKIPFEFSTQTKMNLRTVKDILEVEIKDRVWLDKTNSKSIAYNLEKEIKDKEAGKGFKIARTYLDDNVVATITKGYFRNQSTNPILVHPEDNERFSWFTPRELARLQGLEDTYLLPSAKNKAGEIIGQGVAQEPFSQVAEDIKKYFKNYK